MSLTYIGIREFKSRLSHYLRRVKRGETLVITERGKPVGRLVPIEAPLEERLARLMQSGMADWNGRKLPPYRPKAVNRGARPISDLVAEERE